MVRDLPIIAKEGYRPCVDLERVFDIKNLLYFLNENVIKAIIPKVSLWNY